MRIRLLAAGAFATLAVAAAAWRVTRPPAATAPVAEPRRGADDSWALCGPTIAHAFGAINGAIYTNSREAFDANYARGYRHFEVDLARTSDSRIVLAHNWGTPERHARRVMPDYAEFMDSRVTGKYAPLDLDSLAVIARAHPDAWFILDFKDGAPEQIGEVVARFQELAPEALPRLVPQIQHQEDLAPVLASYQFPSIAYTLYATRDTNEEALRFAVANRIGVLVLSQARFDPFFVQDLVRRKVAVYVQTVNTAAEAALYRRWGAAGVVSDVLAPDSACVK